MAVIKKKENEKSTRPVIGDFFGRVWEESWTYIKTVVDIVREPVLILNKDLRVMAANEPFYTTFQVEVDDTEKKIIYDLGNGQWDIPALRKLLENILPQHTFFKGFEVDHEFPAIGRKVMILNARQIHSKFANEDGTMEMCPPIILLAMEDVTAMMDVAARLASRTQNFEDKLTDRTKKLEANVADLTKQLSVLKKKG